MKLEGSCACKSVRFTVSSDHPYPFNRCYCSICRKTAGSGGFGINISADANSLEVQGESHLAVYQAYVTDPETGQSKESPAQRKFCSKCGSHLWVWDPRWPDLLFPHAGAVDSELPTAPEHVHLMLASKAAWVQIEQADHDQYFDAYPNESIADWHERVVEGK